MGSLFTLQANIQERITWCHLLVERSGRKRRHNLEAAFAFISVDRKSQAERHSNVFTRPMLHLESLTDWWISSYAYFYETNEMTPFFTANRQIDRIYYKIENVPTKIETRQQGIRNLQQYTASCMDVTCDDMPMLQWTGGWATPWKTSLYKTRYGLPRSIQQYISAVS